MEILTRLPGPVLAAIEKGCAAIVGGAIRAEFEGSPPKDIDVFFFEAETYHAVCQATGAKLENGWLHRLAGDVDIDLVLAAGMTPAKLSLAADFNIAAGVYSAGRIILPPGFAEAVKTKLLVYRSSEDPEKAYKRLQMFQSRGYRIDHSILKLFADWQALTN